MAACRRISWPSRATAPATFLTFCSSIETWIDEQKVKNVAGAVAREGEEILRQAANQGDTQKR